LSVKRLFDENLSPRLATSVGDLYPTSAHVSAVDLTNAPDEAIWNYAAANGFVIVTKDDDFRQHSFLRGFPPKVIWLRFGNCPTDLIATAFRDRVADVMMFVADPSKALLVLSRIR
jgi:predicted nuclease of predicted toxin-antitoxin system